MTTDYADIFEAERDYVWGLLYRMTGSGADADDLLMDTFERAMTRPPNDASRPWRPWLTTVAANLARDALRKRRRRKYVGPWLPSLEDTSRLPDPATPEARYSARESASYAFLKALEALTPNQRAVLVLRDVFDYSTTETAEALDISEPNTKVTLHRARRAMREYDGRELTLEAEAVQAAIARLMQALLAGDAERLAELLTEDVVLTSDGGGEFTAALRTLEGPDRTSRFLIGLSKKSTPGAPDLLMLNGVPALGTPIENASEKVAKYSLLHLDVAADGRIAAIDIVLATAKMPRKA